VLAAAESELAKISHAAGIDSPLNTNAKKKTYEKAGWRVERRMARPHLVGVLAAGAACVCFLALVGTQVCGGEQG
jgi:hypothetical protein